MVSSEDFSFPKISNPLPHFAISPSLWRVTSVVYPDFSEEEAEGETEKKSKLTRKSFSCSYETDHHHRRRHQKQEKNRLSNADEEKMDLLWEDFNEELQRVSSMDAKKLKQHLQAEKSSSDCCRHMRMKQQQLCCVKTMKGCNNIAERTIICQPKRYNNFVVLVNVLKKMFLLHNSTRINKKR